MFRVRRERESLILSFPEPTNTLSWAVLNGGSSYADHIINHHVTRGDREFFEDPQKWLSERIARLQLEGKVVAMATAVDMAFLSEASFSDGDIEVTCFATVGMSNALTVGDKASLLLDTDPLPAHTINMILLIRPGLRDEAMVEAIQIATEGRVRALYEAGIVSCRSRLPATGTGTDCVAVASLDKRERRYCGKHTKLGELIGRAAYTAVQNGLAKGSATAGP